MCFIPPILSLAVTHTCSLPSQTLRYDLAQGSKEGFPLRSSCAATSRRYSVALVCSPRVLQHALRTAIRLMHQLLSSKPAGFTCKHSVTTSSGVTNLHSRCMGSSNATIRRYSVALEDRPRVFTHALCASYHLDTITCCPSHLQLALANVALRPGSGVNK
jgi:hypothetical protein